MRSRQNNEETEITTSASVKIGEILKIYHAKKGATFNTYRLMLDGQRLTVTLTAKACGLEEGSVIDAMLEQTGGA